MTVRAYIRDKIRRLVGYDQTQSKLDRLLARTGDLAEATKVAATLSSAEFVEAHMSVAKPLESQSEVLDYALSQMSTHDGGLVCEFGVYEGRTINYIATRTRQAVFGFDSFQGLPETWRAGYDRGKFSLGSNGLPACEPNVSLVVGLFDDTLPKFLAEHPGDVTFLHVDCDLYSSTRTVLTLLGQRLPRGAVIVFDEYFNYPGWQSHEHLAFNEYLIQARRQCEYICYNRFHEQVAVKML